MISSLEKAALVRPFFGKGDRRPGSQSPNGFAAKQCAIQASALRRSVALAGRGRQFLAVD
jgi:hypothetical protein